MEVLIRGFDYGELKEDDWKKADKTHFVFNRDDDKTFRFIGDEDVKYTNAISGWAQITMAVRINREESAFI